MRFFTIIFTAFSLTLFSMASHAEEQQHVKTAIYADQTAIVPGEGFTLYIEHNIDKHWHTYWLNPGDSGSVPKFDIQMPEGFEIEKGPNLDYGWPVPERIPFGPLMNFGHKDRAVYAAKIAVPSNVQIGEEIQITVNMEWLVCQDICIPEYGSETLILLVADTSTPDNMDVAAFAYSQFPAPDIIAPGQVTYIEDADSFALVLKDRTEAPQNIAFFPREWGIIQNMAAPEIRAFKDGYHLIWPKDNRDLAELPSDTISGVLQIDGKYALISAEPGMVAGQAEPDQTGPEVTLIWALALAFFGGVILNLMPCVFPVLSIKALSLVQMQEKARQSAVLHGISYTAGIIISFLIIAGALIGLQAAGSQIGWGFQLQNPVVVGLLAYLLFVIGLNLSGYFEFNAAFANTGQSLAGSSGYKGSFFTGVLATLVATPCTAPFMATALGFALTQPPLISLSIFAMLGFGLAFPYLLLTFVPTLQTALPRPGAWMDKFKEFLAFPLYLSALWLAWVFARQSGLEAFICLLGGAVAIAFAIWLIKVRPKKGASRIILNVIIIGLGLFALTVPFIIHDMKREEVFGSKDMSVLSRPFSPSALEQALAGSDPVFVNMTADWCITCKVNERIAIDRAKTRKAIEEFGIQYLKGDWTNQDPEITSYLRAFDRSGVPLYVYYGAPDETGQRPQPKILPQLLTEGMLLETFTH